MVSKWRIYLSFSYEVIFCVTIEINLIIIQLYYGQLGNIFNQKSTHVFVAFNLLFKAQTKLSLVWMIYQSLVA